MLQDTLSSVQSQKKKKKNGISNEVAIAMIEIAAVATRAIVLLLNPQSQKEIPGGWGVEESEYCVFPCSFYIWIHWKFIGQRDHSIKTLKCRGNENTKPGAVETPPAS